MPDITSISGVPAANIVKLAGVAKANISAIISSGASGFSFPGAASTKAIVYDGVDATSLVISDHSLAEILRLSSNNAATLSIWVNLDGVTDTSAQNIYGFQSTAGGQSVARFLRIKRTSTSTPSNIEISTQNSSDSVKAPGSGTVAFRKTVQASSVAMDNWIHVCVVHKQSAGGTGYDTSIFVNGSSTSDITGGSSLTATNTLQSNTNVGLGSNLLDTIINSFEEMKLSDYIVWSDELTSSEITEIYNAGVGGFDPSTDSGNYASSADLEIHYEVGNDAEDTTEAPVTNNTGTTGNLTHTNVEFELL